MYSVEGLSISRKGRPIFRDTSCTVRPGEVLGLVAPNGMGKTTLLRFLAGAWALGSASTVTLGEDRVKDPKSLGRHVFYVSGDRSPLYPGLSPRQHLQIERPSMWVAGSSGAEWADMRTSRYAAFRGGWRSKLSWPWRSPQARAISCLTSLLTASTHRL